VDPEAVTVNLTATSAAQDAAFVALADSSSLVEDATLRPSRLIGGQMVALLLAVHGIVMPRETRDADLGFTPAVLNEPTIGSSEGDGLRAQRREPLRADAARRSRRRRRRAGESGHRRAGACIHRRARSSTRFGHPPHLDTTEVFGLAFAFKRPPMVVELELRRRNGEILDATLDLPDEPSALILKAGAWQARREQRDAVDVHRTLCIARSAGNGPSDFEDSAIEAQVEVLRSDFGSMEGEGLAALAIGLSASEAERRTTETRALVQRLIA